MRLAIFFFLFTTSALAEAPFEKGTRELGISNLGIGHSSVDGFMVSANTRYQSYVLNRFGLGGFGFYNNFNNREWMGFGPSATYILFNVGRVFSRYDQLLTFSKFNNFDTDYATTYGTSILSLNYLPEDSRFFIGAGYGLNYNLSRGKSYNPNFVQVNFGFLF